MALSIMSALPARHLGQGLEHGVEYGHLELRGQADANRFLGYGDHGTMNRIQFSAQYNLF